MTKHKDKKQKSSKAGRPRIEIEWDKLDAYLSLKSSKRVCALLLGISEDTIERAIQRDKGCSFTDYADKCLAPTKLKLVQKALTKALNGDNTMLIFSLKNLCGWADKVETYERGEGYEFSES